MKLTRKKRARISGKPLLSSGIPQDEMIQRLASYPGFKAGFFEEYASLVLADAFRKMRKRAHLDLNELANRSGLSMAEIDRLERQTNKTVKGLPHLTLTLIARIAEACGRKVKITFPKLDKKSAKRLALISVTLE